MSALMLMYLYISRFVTLIHLKSTAKLEFSRKDGKVTVNICHDLGEVEETNLKQNTEISSYMDVLKDNVKPSQFHRLQNRACARAEEARITFREQRGITERAVSEVVKSKAEAEEAIPCTEKAKANTKLIVAEAEKFNCVL